MVKILEGSNDQRLVCVPMELARAMDIDHGQEWEWEVVDSDTLQIQRT